MSPELNIMVCKKPHPYSRNKLLIDRLEHYPEIESIMDGLEKIANKEGVPLTTILKVIWALETM